MPMDQNQLAQINTFLAQAEPEANSKRFIIGAFESGITVYKQQVRALNLIYALHVTDRLKQGARIAIIGGGISGVTAAAAASALGDEVYLFERSPVLLHLQHGCDTRWVHPHIYDWPARGSLRPYAGLPLVDWREGTAGAVVEQIRRDYERIKGERKAGKIHEHLGAKIIRFLKPLRVDWSGLGDPKNGQESFDAVIFAVGFGVERQVDEKKTISYWRNDSVNQLIPGSVAKEMKKYLISGTGDGGLIDLLRVRIQSFHQGRILHELIPAEDDSLISGLRKIAEDWGKSDRPEGDDWLYRQYTRLQKRGLLKRLKDSLKPRLRTDTEAILNGKPEYLSQALRLDRASVFNTLVTFVLHSDNEFEYRPGEFKVDSDGARVDGVVVPDVEVIIRHGTDREGVFKDASFAEGIAILQKQDPIRRRIDTAKGLWPAGWWGEQAKDVLSGEREEFVPPATQAIATTFVSTLSDIIGLYKSSEAARFRITLHRLINVNGEDFFQQISRYAGTKTTGRVGRVFDVSGGLVGLACRLGRPVQVIRDEHFADIWAALHFDNLAARKIDDRVQALFACPFLAPERSGTRPKYVSLVLFMDSEQPDFFTPEVMKTVYAACRGFVQNLETMNSNGDVFFASSDYLGYDYANKKPEAEKVVKQFASVKTDNEEFKNFVEDLTFKTVTFFDAYLK